MTSFPFYDTMCKDTKNSDLTVKQKNEFISKIQSIDKNGAELVYALIRVYEINNEENSGTFKLPYCGKYVDKDMHFDLEKLPQKLRQILYKFVNIHVEKLNEDQIIARHSESF